MCVCECVCVCVCVCVVTQGKKKVGLELFCLFFLSVDCLCLALAALSLSLSLCPSLSLSLPLSPPLSLIYSGGLSNVSQPLVTPGPASPVTGPRGRRVRGQECDAECTSGYRQSRWPLTLGQWPVALQLLIPRRWMVDVTWDTKHNRSVSRFNPVFVQGPHHSHTPHPSPHSSCCRIAL